MPESYDRERRLLRLGFLVLLGLWLVVPLVRYAKPAQDAIIVIVAGDLAASDSKAVYLHEGSGAASGDVSPALKQRFCAAYETPAQCAPEVTPFTNPPMVLPVTWALSHLDLDLAVFLFRLAVAASLAVGFELLWRTVVADRDRALWFTAITALCTPLAVSIIDVGQNSAFLFLAVVAGVTGTAGVWFEPVATTLATIFKGFPLVAVAVWSFLERRAARLAVVVASTLVLTVLAVWLSGWRVIGDFIEGTRTISQGTGYPHDTSLDAMIERIVGHGVAIAWGVRLLVVWPFVRILRASRTSAERWALSWLLVTALMPKVWPHYLLLVLPAFVAVALARRPEVDLRPLAAACVGLLATGILNGSQQRWLPWVQPPTLVAIGVVLVVAGRGGLVRRPLVPVE